MRILVADDAAPLRALFAHVARGLGHEVVAEAADSGELLRLAACSAVDAVVIDGRLPPAGAVAVVARVRQCLPKAAIFIVAALGEKALVREAREAGATGAIGRPFLAEHLATALGGADDL